MTRIAWKYWKYWKYWIWIRTLVWVILFNRLWRPIFFNSNTCNLTLNGTDNLRIRHANDGNPCPLSYNNMDLSAKGSEFWWNLDKFNLNEKPLISIFIVYIVLCYKEIYSSRSQQAVSLSTQIPFNVSLHWRVHIHSDSNIVWSLINYVQSYWIRTISSANMLRGAHMHHSMISMSRGGPHASFHDGNKTTTYVCIQ